MTGDTVYAPEMPDELKQILAGTHDQLQYLYMREAAGHFLQFASMMRQSKRKIRQTMAFYQMEKNYVVKIDGCLYMYNTLLDEWLFSEIDGAYWKPPISITDPAGIYILNKFFRKLFWKMYFNRQTKSQGI